MTAREAVARAVCDAERGEGFYETQADYPMVRHYRRMADAALAEARPYIREECAKVAEDCDDSFDTLGDRSIPDAYCDGWDSGHAAAQNNIAAKLRSMTDD